MKHKVDKFRVLEVRTNNGDTYYVVQKLFHRGVMKKKEIWKSFGYKSPHDYNYNEEWFDDVHETNKKYTLKDDALYMMYQLSHYKENHEIESMKVIEEI